MKILYAANRAEIFSGGQISLLELLSGLNRSCFEPLVLCPGEGEMASRIRDMGIDVRLWDMPAARSAGIAGIRKKIRELRSIIRECGADIVHTNGSRAQFYASVAVKNTGTSLIWHVREAKRDSLFYDWFLAKAADRIVCVSEAVKNRRFGRFSYFLRKTRVVYNGVDIRKFLRDEEGRKSVRDELGVGEKQVLAGVVGILIPRKGHDFLLKGLSRAAKRYHGIKLFVIGKSVDSAYAERLKTMARDFRITDKVVFSGSREDIGSVLSALDMFILPSRSEGFSRGLLEAMACSLPIITTDVEGNNEAIVDGESGILVPYGDVDGLASAMGRCAEDTDSAKRMGRNARKRVEECFTVERHVSRMQELYEELKKGRRRCG